MGLLRHRSHYAFNTAWHVNDIQAPGLVLKLYRFKTNILFKK
jgi:hypothetical protein